MPKTGPALVPLAPLLGSHPELRSPTPSPDRQVPAKLRRNRRMVPTMNKRTILGFIIGAALAGFMIAVIEVFNLDVYLF